MPGRTYRTSAGHSILVGGLARVDVLDHAGATLYLTVFTSATINLHLGESCVTVLAPALEGDTLAGPR